MNVRFLHQTKLRLPRFFSDQKKPNPCKYEARLDNFKAITQPRLHSEYSLFLQEMRQYFHRDAYNLYDLTFLKHILKNSTKRDTEYQISSIVYFRKKRRYTDFNNDDEFFNDVKSYMNDFYEQRNGEIASTFKDLCLDYEIAAQAIFDQLSKNDQELHSLLNDNTLYTKLIPSIYNQLCDETNQKVSKALELMGKEEHILILSKPNPEEAWIHYVANHVRMFDEIFKHTGLEEEDLHMLTSIMGKTDIVQMMEKKLCDKTLGKYTSVVLSSG